MRKDIYLTRRTLQQQVFYFNHHYNHDAVFAFQYTTSFGRPLSSISNMCPNHFSPVCWI